MLNRTAPNADRLASEYAARSVPLTALTGELAEADIVVSCTGAPEPLVRLADVVTARGSSDRPLTVIDLALPHDVDPSVADLPGVKEAAEEIAGYYEARDFARASRRVMALADQIRSEAARFMARVSSPCAP